jgi:hypothetical protein
MDYDVNNMITSANNYAKWFVLNNILHIGNKKIVFDEFNKCLNNKVSFISSIENKIYFLSQSNEINVKAKVVQLAA